MFDFNATLPLMALQFLLLAALLNTIFYKPLTKALDDRDNYVRDSYVDANERLAQAQKLTYEYEEKLADARRQSQSIVTNAQTEAQKVTSQRVADAQKEAQIRREGATKEIEQQKNRALSALEKEVDALSKQIMEKLLGSSLAR